MRDPFFPVPSIVMRTSPTSERGNTRRPPLLRACSAILAAGFLPAVVSAQAPFTWQQVKDRFQAANPTLRAAQLSIDESRAAEITAYLRPNPDLTGTIDQINPLSTIPSPVSGNSVYRPFANTLPFGSLSYLHERGHKRELRLESARKSTDISASTYSDQERTLLFNLRNAFVQTLQAKVVRQNARENLRTAKIQLLTLLNDRTPIEQFDVIGPFDFSDTLMPLEEFRTIAMADRPDLKAALQSVELAKTNHLLAVANGSTDPTLCD